MIKSIKHMKKFLIKKRINLILEDSLIEKKKTKFFAIVKSF